MKSSILPALLLWLPLAAAQAQPAAPAIAAISTPISTPYDGEIALTVDATDLDHKVMRVQETLPVQPGALTLHFPRWLPGTHGPGGDVARLGGLKFSARGQVLAWTRDALDSHAFHLDVPAGASVLDIEFQHLSPVSKASGRVTVTREMLNVQWNDLVLYPANYAARAIGVRPALKLPAGWAWAGALRAAPGQPRAGLVQFQPVSLETLVDSPLFAGSHLRRFELDPPGTARPVVLNLFADREEQLGASAPQIEAHRELVRQADRLFASRHFAHYDLLLALSDDLGGIGLEHHESSENGVKPDYFEKWDQAIGARELLPHEYTHSWNGKFRRPADLLTPNFNLPMRDSLLWVYEGQTQFWGWVLAARSGLTSAELAREHLAQTAAVYEHRSGRVWRNLQDTTQDPIAARYSPKDWRDWQRGAGDYYEESLLIWLDADMLIRERSAGKRSLDDFARAFFGVQPGEIGPLPYTFEDVAATLSAVQPDDWTAMLRQRLDTHEPAAPLAGLARAGWTLEYADKPSAAAKAREAEDKNNDFSWSLGLVVAQDGKIENVLWGSPAFAAGLAPALTLLAVNQRAYKPELLRDAISANRGGQAPIELLLREGDLFRSVRIDYREGQRYPRLVRLQSTEDRLATLLAPR